MKTSLRRAAPPPTGDGERLRQHAYWRVSLRLTLLLLAIWFTVTLASTWFAEPLNGLVLFGFPLGFYMGAQGSLLVYLLIIWIYGRTMSRLDRQYGVDELDDH